MSKPNVNTHQVDSMYDLPEYPIDNDGITFNTPVDGEYVINTSDVSIVIRMSQGTQVRIYRADSFLGRRNPCKEPKE